MSIPLREATAGQEIPLGHFVSSSDGDTETTPTVANTDIKIWKRDATTLANKNSGGATHISNGVAYTVLDATDTNTLGPLVVFIHVAGSLGIRVECCVYPANVFDALFLGTDALDVEVASVAANAITAAAIATDAVTEIQTGLSTFDHTSHNVTVDPNQAPAVGPTPGTFDDMLAKATTALPDAAPGAAAGLALAANIFAIAATGTVASVTNAGDFTLDFTGYLGSHSTDGQFARMFLVFDRNQAADNAGIPRQITTYTGATRRVQFSGTGTDIDRPFPTAPSGGENVTILGLA